MDKLTKTFPILAEQPVFAGHFPGHPLLPGVMLLAFARDTVTSTLGRCCRIRNILRQKFLEPTLPGHTIVVECQLSHANIGSDVKATCHFFNQDGKMVAKGDYVIEWLP